MTDSTAQQIEALAAKLRADLGDAYDQLYAPEDFEAWEIERIRLYSNFGIEVVEIITRRTS